MCVYSVALNPCTRKMCVQRFKGAKHRREDKSMTYEINYSRIHMSDYNMGCLAEHIFEDMLGYDDMDDDNMTDYLYDSINDNLIYYDDMWNVLKCYCSPEEADWNYAVDEFTNELLDCISNGVFESTEVEVDDPYDDGEYDPDSSDPEY